MKNENLDLNNYFGEDENEIQFYDTAFPSLSTTACAEVNCSKSIQFSNDLLELSLVHSPKSSKSVQFITDTFVIPHEERRYIVSDSGKLKKLLTDICANNGVRVETNVTPNQSLGVFISGQKVMVLEAKKRIMRVLQTQFETVLDIPKEYHRNLIGIKGAFHKDLENETSTQISYPKFNDSSTIIKIKGSKDGIEHARQLIEERVDELSKVGRQVVEIDKRYHQLVCSKSNAALHIVLERKKLRLDIPPISVEKNEISISGDRDGVAQAASILLQIYNHMKSTYQELQIEIPKEKHRFIIGPRGSGIKEILDQTNVWIDINDSKSNEGSQNTICLLGPKESLGSALTMVFTKSESINITSIDAPAWLHKFIIGKNGSNLVELSTSKPNINLSFETESNEIVIEGPPEEVLEVSEILKKKVFDLQSRLSQLEIEIDPIMIKHVIGSGGSNIQRIRKETNCSIIFPMDRNNKLVSIIGTPDGVEVAKTSLMKTIETIENTKKKDIIFTHTFMPQLIGQHGKGLKEIKDKYPDVRINFPPQDAPLDLISLIGPRKEVDLVALYLQKKHTSLLESNYSEKVKIPFKYHKSIIGRDGITIRELTKTTNTKFQIPPVVEEKDEIIITGKKSDVEAVIKKVYNIYEKESNIIEVGIEIPKNLHTILIGKGGSRIIALKESCGGRVTIRFPSPDVESNTVIIKGVKDDVLKAQVKLHDLVEEITASNYEEIFQLTLEEYEFLFMSADLKTRKLKESFSVRINESEDKTTLRIIGQKENVQNAFDALQKAKLEMGPIVLENLTLTINDLVYFQKSSELNRIGRDHLCKLGVPMKKLKINSNDKGILEFRGPIPNVKAAMKEILSIIEEYENTITESLIIDERQLRNIEWYSQPQLTEIRQKYNVQIQFPYFPEPASHNESRPQNSSKSIEKPYVNGVDSSFSEEESFKSLSPNPNQLPHDIISGHNPNGNKNHDVSEINSEVSSTISAGINLARDSATKTKLPKYKIAITGHKDKIALAKEAIVNLFVVDLEVNVPPEYYPALIGTKGDKIRKLRTTHQVEIIIPTKNTKTRHVIVSGQSDRAVAAKKEILEFVDELSRQKYEREIKNFQLAIHIPCQYHRQLIGSKGETISKIRTKHSVRISVPLPDSDIDEIMIHGHKDNVENAKQEILAFVNKLESRIIEVLNIDSRIHSRLIGSRGANLDQLKKKYKVEIVFPIRGTEGEEANIVRVKGTKNGVDKCADELIDRANVMLDELNDQMVTVVVPPTPNNRDSNGPHHESPPLKEYVSQKSGFQIRNAPWDSGNSTTKWVSDTNHSTTTATSTDDNDQPPPPGPQTSWRQVLSQSKTNQ